jgi:hypothetical protein
MRIERKQGLKSAAQATALFSLGFMTVAFSTWPTPNVKNPVADPVPLASAVDADIHQLAQQTSTAMIADSPREPEVELIPPEPTLVDLASDEDPTVKEEAMALLSSVGDESANY